MLEPASGVIRLIIVWVGKTQKNTTQTCTHIYLKKEINQIYLTFKSRGEKQLYTDYTRNEILNKINEKPSLKCIQSHHFIS